MSNPHEVQYHINVKNISYARLIQRLINEGKTNEQAVYIANHCDANWFDNAVIRAREHINGRVYSYKGLIQQLESDFGDKFTHEQAVYGADNCGANWFDNAVRRAIEYVKNGRDSYKGLIDQLESDKFTHEQAVYGADHCGADWFDNAVRCAISYDTGMSYSYRCLIDQLESKVGEKFTHEQAVYGADNCGADFFENAVITAKSYMRWADFTYEQLIHQLESAEKFTHEQAVYGADSCDYIWAENISVSQPDESSHDDNIHDTEAGQIADKEEVLLNSFELLKNDVKSNYESILKIFCQLIDKQPETVIELWLYLLQHNWEDVVSGKGRDSISAYLTYITMRVINIMNDNNKFELIEEYFISEQKILQAVYQYAPALPVESTSIIAIQIKKHNFEKAGVMLEYMFHNEKNDFTKDYTSPEQSYYNIFKSMIEKYILTQHGYGTSGSKNRRRCDPDEFRFLSYWVDQIKDSTQKAETDVILMELV